MHTVTQEQQGPKTFWMVLLLFMLSAILAACGGGNATTDTPESGEADGGSVAEASEGPEERIASFFNDFGTAMSDPEIGMESKQTEWAETLANYAPPEQREEALGAMTDALSEFGSITQMLEEQTGQTDLDIRMQMEFTDIETELVSETDTTAEVALAGGIVKMELVGDGVEQLGDMAGMLNQEVPISEMFGPDMESFPMTKIDNVWYIDDLNS
ncbi:MAG: hypothetical protein GFH27_549297n217 [Chloroflexi bacterium AL-W]|nr:hypothetical protein [Chloroflexi bacterium AL-N1]NOK68929.1 hypothetical protein [Chloroflexi bacterium AL-N10]NOK76912.1 hypothetical protein [Chloroflexi bacterium AL-N5]NOK82700.1 hypothetical protein [Chloroflexi bacterium AL-W]NOK90769.1 hypothetical protein [Chloroflexi bacterium AL-N15]